MQLEPTQLATLQAQLAALNRTIAKLQRELKPTCPTPASTGVIAPSAPSYRLCGQEFPARNGNDILVSLFRHFAELEPEFPGRFQQASRRLGRSRCYVGRSPQEVYPTNTKLWAQTAEYAPGWYLGTNENNQTKLKLLRAACKVIGLRFGVDVQARM